MFVNGRIKHYGGLAVHDVIGRHFSEFVHADDLVRSQEMIEQALADVPIFEFHFRFLLRDGRFVRMVANGGLAEFDGGKAAMAICRDVTESADLNDKLIERNSTLSALSEADAFAHLKQKCRNQNKTLRQVAEEFLAADEAFLDEVAKDPPKKSRLEA